MNYPAQNAKIYTEGLYIMGNSDPSQPLPAIEGMPPDLSALPVGCAFAPRCPKATRECEASRPALAKVSEGHLKACFNT